MRNQNTETKRWLRRKCHAPYARRFSCLHLQVLTCQWYSSLRTLISEKDEAGREGWLTEFKRRPFHFMQSTNPNDGDHLLPDVIPAFFCRRAGGFNSDEASSIVCIDTCRSGSSLSSCRKSSKKEKKRKETSCKSSIWHQVWKV